METVNVSDLRNRLPDYLSRAEAGEEIEVTRRGEVIARLVPARDLRRTAKERLAALECLRSRHPAPVTRDRARV